MIIKGQQLNDINLNAAFMSKSEDNVILGSLNLSNAAESLTVAGNVGIATAGAPTEKLEIGGTNAKIYLNSATSNMLLLGAAGIGAPTFTTRSAGTKVVLFPSVNGSQTDYAIGVDNSTVWLSVPLANSGCSFKFYGATTEVMRIRGDGNVGINNTGPSEKLEITGNAKVNGNVIATTFRTTSGTSTKIYGGDATSNVGHYVDILPCSTSYGIVLREDNGSSKWANLQVDSVARPDKLFITYMVDGSSTANAGIDINATGDLGVSGDLTVNGNKITFGNGSTIDNETNTTLKIIGDGYTYLYGTSGAHFLSLDSIAAYLNNNGEAQSWLQMDGSIKKIGFGSGAATRDTWLYRDAVNSLKTDGALNVTGRIVTGQSGVAAAYQMESRVNSNGLNYALYLRNVDGTETGGNAVGLGFVNETASTQIKAAIVHERTGSYGRGTLHFLNNDTVSGVSATLADSRMSILANGNVGIGTTAPGVYKLNVSGNTNITGTLNVTSTVTATGYTGIRVQDLPLKRYRKTKVLAGAIVQSVSTAMTTIDAAWTDIQWDANSHVMVIVDGSINAPVTDYTLGATNTVTFLYDVPAGSTFDIIVF